MKTAFATSLKDNIAAATVLSAILIAIVGSLVASGDARAERNSQSAARQTLVQKMDTIVVTTPRHYPMVKMDAVVITASRQTDETATVMMASK